MKKKKVIGNVGMAVLKEPTSKSWKGFSLFLHKFYLKNSRQSISAYTTHRLAMFSVYFREVGCYLPPYLGCFPTGLTCPCAIVSYLDNLEELLYKMKKHKCSIQYFKLFISK